MLFDRRRILQGFAASAVVTPMSLSAQERDGIVEAARKEGKVAFATSISASSFPKFLQAFTAKYPFIDVNSGYYSAPTGRVLARLEAEMLAGNLSFDVFHAASLAPFLAMASRTRRRTWSS